nr:MAG TPA: hypothetical protein [Caudoviricetes sp.]
MKNINQLSKRPRKRRNRKRTRSCKNLRGRYYE